MKVALITGAARRIGACIAKAMHAQQYHVVLHYHHSKREAELLENELNVLRPHSAKAISCDLFSPLSPKKMIEEAVSIWGRVDLLVNNASNFFPTNVGEITFSEWQSLMTVNLQTPFFLNQAAFPFLKKTKGNIITIADIHAEKPMRHYSVYCIAKSGVIMMTKALAKEMAPEVRVNAISPGTVLSPEGVNALTEEQQEKIKNKICLKRMGTPNDVAQAVIYLSQATYVTGEVMVVDGGRL